MILGLCLFLALDAVEVFARAGGGEGYSGGYSGGSSGSGWSGGGSSRHGGGSSGDAEVVYLLVRLVIEYPMIGIPLCLFIIALVFAGSREGGERYVDHTIRRGVVAQDGLRRRRAEDTLKKRDPAWNSAAMITRAKAAFALIQEAWSENKLEKAQAFLSDAIFEKFSVQLADLKARGIIDRIDSITLHDARIAQLESDEAFDTLHIYFKAYTKNVKIDAATGRQLSDDSGPFEEYWSFLRRPGAKSLVGKGLIEGYCPNCSAPVSLNRASTCGVCNSFLRSGEYDWVLSEITQASAWTGAEAADVPGLAAFRTLDPGFSIQQMEDLASVVFYRHAVAMRSGSVEPVAKFALDSFVTGLAESLRGPGDGTRMYDTDGAIGSVEAKLVEAGEPFDRVWVEITWSGKNTRRLPDGREVIGAMSPPRRHFHVFVRRHGVVTDTRLSLSSAHCPNCGAPEQNVADPVCPYCQTVRNDGSKGWVLESILPSSPEHRNTLALKRQQRPASIPPVSTVAPDRPLPDLPGPSASPVVADSGSLSATSPDVALACMIHVMMSDGVIDDREERCLRDFAIRCRVDGAILDAMIQNARQAGAGDVSTLPVPNDPVAARSLLRNMAAMALADGRLSNDELAALQGFASRFGLSPADVKLLVSQERSRIYAEAKKAIAESKKNPS
ncbi:MAG TPA: TIM44-like domain-containing protein [Candidatus Ozemobacteraceae bacterium]|nr:TIM44-like domain-containing protein [Candidatus Ozemobacteraceae bacterium]